MWTPFIHVFIQKIADNFLSFIGSTHTKSGAFGRNSREKWFAITFTRIKIDDFASESQSHCLWYGVIRLSSVIAFLWVVRFVINHKAYSRIPEYWFGRSSWWRIRLCAVFPSPPFSAGVKCKWFVRLTETGKWTFMPTKKTTTKKHHSFHISIYFKSVHAQHRYFAKSMTTYMHLHRTECWMQKTDMEIYKSAYLWHKMHTEKTTTKNKTVEKKNWLNQSACWLSQYVGWSFFSLLVIDDGDM